MALDIKEFSGIAGNRQVAMQPDIEGTAAGLTSGGSYTVVGAGGGPSIIELYANGAGHSFTVTGGKGRTQAIASGERLVYGFAKGAVITVTA